MPKVLPEIAESVGELRKRLQRERHAIKLQRLQVLYVVASGQAKSRQAAGECVGVGRNAAGRWLDKYEREGLAGLLVVHRAPGKAARLSAAQLAQLRQALGQPEGFASYKAVQNWLEAQFGIILSYTAVHKIVRYKLGATLKVVRPAHPKKTRRR